MMQQRKTRWKQCLSVMLAAAVMVSFMARSASAAEVTLEAGTYQVEGKMSMFVSAMGGIEFADGIFKGAFVTVDESGSARIKLSLGSGYVNIYSISCATFIDPAVTPGYYANGAAVNADYTVSEATALDPGGKQVNFVDSMTFPIDLGTESVDLWLYVNSQVMGCQFGDGSGSAGSNTPGQATPYIGKLTLNWEKVSQVGESSTAESAVELVMTGGYEIDIPAKIGVDAGTLTGSYEVTSTRFAVTGSVAVTADESGVLTGSVNGKTVVLPFTNRFDTGAFTAAGQTRQGTVTVTPPAGGIAQGTYTGRMTFTIVHYPAAS